MTGVRPPPEHEGKLWHWVRLVDSTLEPMLWTGSWGRARFDEPWTPEQAERQRWSYHGPCEPPQSGWETRG